LKDPVLREFALSGFLVDAPGDVRAQHVAVERNEQFSRVVGVVLFGWGQSSGPSRVVILAHNDHLVAEGAHQRPVCYRIHGCAHNTEDGSLTDKRISMRVNHQPRAIQLIQRDELLVYRHNKRVLPIKLNERSWRAMRNDCVGVAENPRIPCEDPREVV
jgi:hypothetical protein